MREQVNESTAENIEPLSADATLYALILQLRPVQAGTLMPFSGELAHGAWLRWLGDAAPEVAARLHAGNQRRLFTCSSLRFPSHSQMLMRAERENIHLRLDPGKRYEIRITLLLDELYPLLHEALMRFHRAEDSPFIQLGKQFFLLERVVLDNEHSWTGIQSLRQLARQASERHFARNALLPLEFATLTTFNRSNAQSKKYGPHYARLPLPPYIFPNLSNRWHDIAPPDLAALVDREQLEAYIRDDGIIIDDYDLKTHKMHFTTHIQTGFIGTCVYAMRGPDDASGGGALTLRQQLWLLTRLAFYSGVGYKTAMGLGQVRPL